MDNLGLIKNIRKKVYDKQIENMSLEGRDNVEIRKELNKYKILVFLKNQQDYIVFLK